MTSIKNPTATTKEYFELIPNERDVMPRKGDIIVIKPDDTYFPNGFFAIATGNEIGVRNEEIFVQYHGSLVVDGATSQLAVLPLEITYGWMRPKKVFNADNTNSVTAGVGQGGQGEVLGTQSKIDKLFEKFYEENKGNHEEPTPIIRWLNALGIPKDSMISGYDFSEGVEVFIKNPTEATKQFFEVIPYEERIKPRTGDFVILSPNEAYETGRIAISTGEITEDGTIGVFTGDAELDRFALEEISGLLRPKGFENEEGQVYISEQGGGEVLGAKTGPIDQIYIDFQNKYNGLGVEASDDSNKEQCVDLIWAWLSELGIPWSSIRNFDPEHPYASQIYTNADDETRKYFDIIGYKEGVKFQTGDIVVWNQNIGNIAGHVAVSTGEENSYFSQNYPIGSKSILKKLSSDGIIGALRPKGFTHSETTEEPGKYIDFPDFEGTPSEKAKYAFITQVFNYMNIPETDEESMVEWTDYPTDKLIEIAQALARGEVVNLDEPIIYYFTSYRDIYNGIAYLNSLQVTIDNEDLISNADIANGLEWKGDPYLSAIIKVGMNRTSSEDLDLSKITATTPWMDVHTQAHTELRSDSAFVNLSCEYGVRREGACLARGPGIVEVFWIHDDVLMSGGISD